MSGQVNGNSKAEVVEGLDPDQREVLLYRHSGGSLITIIYITGCCNDLILKNFQDPAFLILFLSE
jgi:hypothetical protein